MEFLENKLKKWNMVRESHEPFTYLDFILECYPDEEFLTADNFNDAIIGLEVKSMRIIYSKRACIEILLKSGMNLTEAIEFFEFNVEGAYIGEKTPIWCEDFF
jgi:hypothetical protein